MQQVRERQPCCVSIKDILQGISQLVESLMHFAAEFGIPLQRVLPTTFEAFFDAEVNDALLQWFQTDSQGLEKFQQLFRSLLNHQLALLSALDGVALHTVVRLAPKLLARSLPGRMKQLTLPLDDQQFLELQKSRQRRYQELIVPGFIDAYLTARGEYL